MKKYLLFLFLILLGNYGFTEETIEKLYQKAENLYNQIEDKTPSIKNIPKYKEISEILEEIINKNPQDKELLKKTYQLLIISYDNQARYQEKYQTMKKYAQLLYPEDQEKQATYLKEQADKLKEQGEIGEAIMIYRFIAKDYSETEIAPETLYEVAKIIEDEESKVEAVAQTIKEYENLIKNYPKSKFAEEAYFKVVRMYQSLAKYSIAIKYLEEFLNRYPDSKKIESAMFYLGILYKENKKGEEAKKVWEEYLKRYPEGVYKELIKAYLKGGEK